MPAHQTRPAPRLSRRRFVIYSIVIATSAVLPLIATPALAATDPIYTSLFSSKAVGGYDTVAYFTEGKPTKGKSEFKLDYMGAQWFFANQENLDKFKDDPDRYAPQYGGYCAYAIAINDITKGDPKQWHIEDDKLYLNINAKIKNKWLGDVPGYIESAEKYWPGILKR